MLISCEVGGGQEVKRNGRIMKATQVGNINETATQNTTITKYCYRQNLVIGLHSALLHSYC